MGDFWGHEQDDGRIAENPVRLEVEERIGNAPCELGPAAASSSQAWLEED